MIIDPLQQRILRRKASGRAVVIVFEAHKPEHQRPHESEDVLFVALKSLVSVFSHSTFGITRQLLSSDCSKHKANAAMMAATVNARQNFSSATFYDIRRFGFELHFDAELETG